MNGKYITTLLLITVKGNENAVEDNKMAAWFTSLTTTLSTYIQSHVSKRDFLFFILFFELPDRQA